jgi:hypothetical protein
MYSVSSRYPCPRCKVPSLVYHCKSPYCTWHICTKCPVNGKTVVFFTRDNRYFIRGIDGS